MKIKKCPLSGLLLMEPEVHLDSRGYFMELYQEEKYRKAGIDVSFVQDNCSGSMKGVLRGLHFQIEHPQAKLIFAPKGEIFDVVVDLRRESDTFGKWHGEILSEENKRQLYIPGGFAHGFLVLSDYAEIIYKCTDYYHPEDEGGIRYDDADLAVEWPLPSGVEPVVSEKDQKLNSFAQWKKEMGSR